MEEELENYINRIKSARCFCKFEENDDETIVHEISGLGLSAAISNKENNSIIDPKKAKRKSNRELQYQRILSSSNPNNRPTYEIPAANNPTSASKKIALKDAACDICQVKFT